MDGLSDGRHALSLAWRCCDCGRLLLYLEPCPTPAACTDCTGTSFSPTGPLSDPRSTYRNAAAQGPTWPFVERRKAPRL